MKTKNKSCLEVKNLSFYYGQKKIFSNINISLNPGELLQIKGVNGSGKTTLLEVISGFRKKSLGKISWGATSKSYLASESNGLFLDLPAVDNINFWTYLKKKKLLKF